LDRKTFSAPQTNFAKPVFSAVGRGIFVETTRKMKKPRQGRHIPWPGAEDSAPDGAKNKS
jgi:hypothetical protein